jgi:hypothetical protein
MLPTQGYGTGGAIASYGYGADLGGGFIYEDVEFTLEIDRSISFSLSFPVVTEFEFIAVENNKTNWPNTLTWRQSGNNNYCENFYAPYTGRVTKAKFAGYRTGASLSNAVKIVTADPTTGAPQQDYDANFVATHAMVIADIQLNAPPAWTALMTLTPYAPGLNGIITKGTRYAFLLWSSVERAKIGYDPADTGFSGGSCMKGFTNWTNQSFDLDFQLWMTMPIVSVSFSLEIDRSVSFSEEVL